MTATESCLVLERFLSAEICCGLRAIRHTPAQAGLRAVLIDPSRVSLLAGGSVTSSIQALSVLGCHRDLSNEPDDLGAHVAVPFGLATEERPMSR